MAPRIARQCNELAELLRRHHPSESLARLPVEYIRNRVEVPFAEGAKPGSLAKVLELEAVGVLVGASLAGLCGGAELELHTGVHREDGVRPLVRGVQPAG